jgi:hypothetical protein
MIWKIVFTGLVVAAVWYGYRLVSGTLSSGKGAQGGISRGSTAVATEDLERCAVCSAYVSPAVAACERDGCPYAA